MSDASHPLLMTALATSGASSRSFAHRHRATYLPGAPEQLLWVATGADPDGGVRLAIAPGSDADGPVSATLSPEALVQRYGAIQIALNRPLLLAPVTVAKPWGREIWFTGIEARGQAGVYGEGGILPLPWLLEVAAPEVLGVESSALNLLKILDPLPEPVYGDLYFELHEEKREVYVVTAVDRRCWPNGVGAIRYGFDPAVRAHYPSDAAFRRAYLESVQAYEAVRDRIQAVEDSWRTEEGYGLRDPVPAATSRRWRAALPPDLRRLEAERRRIMEGFTLLRPLRVGDVVQVPLRLPHALQHGVRTVEFQTPVYERRILSFAQKVLTQDHWDTAVAVAQMHLVPPEAPEREVVQERPGVVRERIVAFDDFVVDRLALELGARWELDLRGHYGLVMGICGRPRVAGMPVDAEAALLLPAVCGRVEVRASDAPALLLIARPRMGVVG